jgi:hypothetical protein
MLNKSKGNMYPFVTHTYNAIIGECEHKCKYCYMLVFPQQKLHLSEKALRQDLGRGNFIFVGSSTDMFADNVSNEWIRRVLEKCRNSDNKYLFQTKNPKRFKEFLSNKENLCDFPKNSILGITLETDMESPSQAPLPMSRFAEFNWINNHYREFDKMISIEPIMDFNLDVMLYWIQQIKPKFVSIGADSKNHNLSEPNREKIDALITELEKFTEVIIKKNMSRLRD